MADKQQNQTVKKISSTSLNWATIGLGVVIVVVLGLVISNLTLNNNEPEILTLEEISLLRPSQANTAVTELNKHLASETDPDKRQQIYGLLEAAYFNLDDIQAAYETLQERENEFGDLNSAQYVTLASLAEQLGKVDEAIGYYEKAIATIPKDDELRQAAIGEYQSEIERLTNEN